MAKRERDARPGGRPTTKSKLIDWKQLVVPRSGEITTLPLLEDPRLDVDRLSDFCLLHWKKLVPRLTIDGKPVLKGIRKTQRESKLREIILHVLDDQSRYALPLGLTKNPYEAKGSYAAWNVHCIFDYQDKMISELKQLTLHSEIQEKQYSDMQDLEFASGEGLDKYFVVNGGKDAEPDAWTQYLKEHNFLIARKVSQRAATLPSLNDLLSPTTIPLEVQTSWGSSCIVWCRIVKVSVDLTSKAKGMMVLQPLHVVKLHHWIEVPRASCMEYFHYEVIIDPHCRITYYPFLTKTSMHNREWIIDPYGLHFVVPSLGVLFVRRLYFIPKATIASLLHTHLPSLESFPPGPRNTIRVSPYHLNLCLPAWYQHRLTIKALFDLLCIRLPFPLELIHMILLDVAESSVYSIMNTR